MRCRNVLTKEWKVYLKGRLEEGRFTNNIKVIFKFANISEKRRWGGHSSVLG